MTSSNCVAGAADGFVALVADVGSEQWHDDTPCSEWDVRILVRHLLYEQQWVPLVAGSGMFGSRIDVGPGAPDDVRLLGPLGRKA